ncbi:DUF4188 domain-containing protein [Streptomyces pacificus]|uniref:DUF4188 domain-containing protein n=1 Tax=Streptomyces pacificus TaxID=2705029 RepID=A0A6A0ARJ3_9ACTN|nr:DUF4188 domain-containing protein [Streptomyces pacificus]GFH35530.1 DUF4188 domain-containing protein [Streptomyces pacificus]
MGSTPINGRMTADAQGDVTVFLIGMRINSYCAVRSWWPVFRAMSRMLKELSRDEGVGLLGYRLLLGGPRLLVVVQYWDSAEKLFAYAEDPGKGHRPAWAAFNRRMREGRGRVGFWHETYIVPAGSYENVYVNMPAYGLAAATGVVPVARRGDRAADRLRSA